MLGVEVLQIGEPRRAQAGAACGARNAVLVPAGACRWVAVPVHLQGSGPGRLQVSSASPLRRCLLLQHVLQKRSLLLAIAEDIALLIEVVRSSWYGRRRTRRRRGTKPAAFRGARESGRAALRGLGDRWLAHAAARTAAADAAGAAVAAADEAHAFSTRCA